MRVKIREGKEFDAYLLLKDQIKLREGPELNGHLGSKLKQLDQRGKEMYEAYVSKHGNEPQKILPEYKSGLEEILNAAVNTYNLPKEEIMSVAEITREKSVFLKYIKTAACIGLFLIGGYRLL